MSPFFRPAKAEVSTSPPEPHRDVIPWDVIPCGFRLFGFMPPCVLPAGHEGEHQDGFGGYYSEPESEAHE